MKYYLIAGEASGDLHGANLMRALIKLDPEADFRFWGGERMARVGGQQVMHYRDTAYMGFLEVLKNLPSILQHLKYCKNDILDYQPDALVLIDYPGFNIRIAQWARQSKLVAKTIYYISPQIWAWKAGRAKILKKVVDRMIVILPFEAEFYARYHFSVDYVGHPLLDHLTTDLEEEPLRTRYKLEAKPIIALLPGSRRQEVQNHLHVMLKMVPHFTKYQFVIAGVSALPVEAYAAASSYEGVTLLVDDTNRLLKDSKIALVASGTATLETALMGVPQIVCYRGSWFTYVLAKKLIKVKYISLVNLILDRPLVRELIQNALTSQALIEEINQILNPHQIKKIKDGYQELRIKLGEHGASRRAAEVVMDTIFTHK